jgi:hypothetical protein
MNIRHFDVILLTSINWGLIFLPPIPFQALYIHGVINRGAPRREGLLDCCPPPCPKNQNLKKHRVCRNDDLKQFMGFTLQLKSASEIS